MMQSTYNRRQYVTFWTCPYLQTTFLKEVRTPNLTALVCIHYKIYLVYTRCSTLSYILCLIVGAMHMYVGCFYGEVPRTTKNLLRNRVTSRRAAGLIQRLIK